MTNVVRPCAQRAQAVLDQRLALAVEARGRLVEHQDARVGQDRARDRDALALPARQLDAALADDRVVLLLEPVDELVGVRDAADLANLLQRRVRPAVADVVGDGAVEQEVVLEHDAELRCGSRAGGPSARSRPSTKIRPLSGRLNAMTRLISVLLPDPLDPTSAVVVPAGAREADTCFSTGTPGLYSKLTSSNPTSPVDLLERRLACCPRRPRSSCCISSWMRSRPANASLICVPIDAICTTGAAMSPVKRM